MAASSELRHFAREHNDDTRCHHRRARRARYFADVAQVAGERRSARLHTAHGRVSLITQKKGTTKDEDEYSDEYRAHNTKVNTTTNIVPNTMEEVGKAIDGGTAQSAIMVSV